MSNYEDIGAVHRELTVLAERAHAVVERGLAVFLMPLDVLEQSARKVPESLQYAAPVVAAIRTLIVQMSQALDRVERTLPSKAGHLPGVRRLLDGIPDLQKN